MEKIRQRLYYLRLQQTQTIAAIEERRREEEERQKRQDEELQAQQDQKQQFLTDVQAPKGKERRSIFSGKKKQTARAEFKPGSGKQ